MATRRAAVLITSLDDARMPYSQMGQCGGGSTSSISSSEASLSDSCSCSLKPVYLPPLPPPGAGPAAAAMLAPAGAGWAAASVPAATSPPLLPCRGWEAPGLGFMSAAAGHSGLGRRPSEPVVAGAAAQTPRDGSQTCRTLCCLLAPLMSLARLSWCRRVEWERAVFFQGEGWLRLQ